METFTWLSERVFSFPFFSSLFAHPGPRHGVSPRAAVRRESQGHDEDGERKPNGPPGTLPLLETAPLQGASGGKPLLLGGGVDGAEGAFTDLRSLVGCIYGHASLLTLAYKLNKDSESGYIE